MANSTSHMPSAVTNGNGAHFAEYPSASHCDTYPEILDQYHSKKSKIRVASVGAGASGMCAPIIVVGPSDSFRAMYRVQDGENAGSGDLGAGFI